jgi:flavodoxin
MGAKTIRHAAREPRVLVCYYSMTGNTRRLAQEVQAALGAGAEELREPRPRQGLPGVARALFDALTRRLPPLRPIHHEPAELDLLVLGGPVWAGRMAGPVRSYMAKFGRRAPRVAFFCTEGREGADQAFAELEALGGRERAAALVVDATHLDAGAHRESLEAFTRTLREALPPGAAAREAGAAAAASVH